MRSVWVIEVRYADDNPGTYGPYTKLQAERIAERLVRETKLSTDVFGISHHPHDVLGAEAVPLNRYDQWLGGAERREVRECVRRERAGR